MKTSEVLERAKAVIEKPQRWTRGAYARDSRGGKVEPYAPTACRWCAVGALRSAQADNRAYRYLTSVVDGSIIEYNDNHTHVDVMNAFDRAIAKARRDECK